MCGNFGFIGDKHLSEKADLLPKEVLRLFKIMGNETEIRGQQAGGALTIGRNRQGQTVFIGEKIVNPKRGNLTKSLESAFCKTRGLATKKGVRPLESTIVGAWHYRFGTSGPPSILETHWHEWTPAKIETGASHLCNE